jgi:hypothetical protein
MHISKTTLLALIHNDNKIRNSYIRPMQSKLIDKIPCIKGPVIEVYFHGEKIHSGITAFIREVIRYKYDREYEIYKLNRPLFLPLDIVRFLRNITHKYLYKSGEKAKKLSAIEVVHSDQHVRAWTTFLQSDAEFLIVFEDDAIFKKNSTQRVYDLINKLSESKEYGPLYVDLAGGCKLDNLRIDKLEKNRDANFRYYTKPVTNTACVYIINRSLAINFHRILAQKPILRLLQIDFLINSLFVFLDKEKLVITSMHADPVIFDHGSSTGDYESLLAAGR